MRSEAAGGVAVAALIVLLVSVAQGWTALAVVAGAVMAGTAVVAAGQRRPGPPRDEAEPPQPGSRPWRDR
ncbi:hypothetical protein [Streptomyces sioyaensis]|uniref:hypothetical protein n=1 Tax=Streptomyces sioyaensis TaxID=67364 RepID=UPI003D70AD1F